MIRSSRKTLLFLAAIALAFVLGGLLAVWITRSLSDSTTVLYRTARFVAGQYWKVAGRTRSERLISANRVVLREKVVFFPESVPETSGGMTAIDDDALLVIDREGGFYHVEHDVVQKLEVEAPDNHTADLFGRFKAGEFGRSDLTLKWIRYMDVLHLRLGKDSWLLASYVEWHPAEKCYTTTLARVQVPATELPTQWKVASSSWEVIYRTHPCLQTLSYEENPNLIMGLEAGGRLVRFSEREVLFTTGSYEWDDRYNGRNFADALAQSDGSSHGRVLRIDFISGEAKEVARGLRNPQGIAVDAQGRAWVTDHGMRGGDEINLLHDGANFGFPMVTYGTRYDHEPAGKSGRHELHEGYDKPVVAFVPSLGLGCIASIQGFHYSWDGDLLVCSMAPTMLHRVHVEDGRAVVVEPVEIGVRARDMVMLSGGRIAVWTDNRRVLYLTAEPDGVGPAQSLMAKLGNGESELAQAARAQIQGCLQCHSLSDGEHGRAPSLHQVCGRAVADTGYPGYSNALKRLGGKWNDDRIAAFISDPQEVAPGSSMVWSVRDQDVAVEIAKALCN